MARSDQQPIAVQGDLFDDLPSADDPRTQPEQDVGATTRYPIGWTDVTFLPPKSSANIIKRQGPDGQTEVAWEEERITPSPEFRIQDDLAVHRDQIDNSRPSKALLVRLLTRRVIGMEAPQEGDKAIFAMVVEAYIDALTASPDDPTPHAQVSGLRDEYLHLDRGFLTKKFKLDQPDVLDRDNPDAIRRAKSRARKTEERTPFALTALADMRIERAYYYDQEPMEFVHANGSRGVGEPVLRRVPGFLEVPEIRGAMVSEWLPAHDYMKQRALKREQGKLQRGGRGWSLKVKFSEEFRTAVFSGRRLGLAFDESVTRMSIRRLSRYNDWRVTFFTHIDSYLNTKRVFHAPFDTVMVTAGCCSYEELAGRSYVDHKRSAVRQLLTEWEQEGMIQFNEPPNVLAGSRGVYHLRGMMRQLIYDEGSETDDGGRLRDEETANGWCIVFERGENWERLTASADATWDPHQRNLGLPRREIVASRKNPEVLLELRRLHTRFRNALKQDNEYMADLEGHAWYCIDGPPHIEAEEYLKKMVDSLARDRSPSPPSWAKMTRHRHTVQASLSSVLMDALNNVPDRGGDRYLDASEALEEGCPIADLVPDIAAKAPKYLPSLERALRYYRDALPLARRTLGIVRGAELGLSGRAQDNQERLQAVALGAACRTITQEHWTKRIGDDVTKLFGDGDAVYRFGHDGWDPMDRRLELRIRSKVKRELRAMTDLVDYWREELVTHAAAHVHSDRGYRYLAVFQFRLMELFAQRRLYESKGYYI